MKIKVLAAAVAVALALAGCANDGGQGSRMSFGDAVVAAVATPVLLALKVPICATTVAIAAPVAGVGTMSPNRRTWVQRELADGVDQNCGPPYVAASR
jgi:hypothetical protein